MTRIRRSNCWTSSTPITTPRNGKGFLKSFGPEGLSVPKLNAVKNGLISLTQKWKRASGKSGNSSDFTTFTPKLELVGASFRKSWVGIQFVIQDSEQDQEQVLRYPQELHPFYPGVFRFSPHLLQLLNQQTISDFPQWPLHFSKRYKINYVDFAFMAGEPKNAIYAMNFAIDKKAMAERIRDHRSLYSRMHQTIFSAF